MEYTGDTIKEDIQQESIDISVIVPITERYDDLRGIYLRHAKELVSRACSYEFVFVIDGPDKEALKVLQTLKKEYTGIKIFALNRWFGEAVALSVGFEHASGKTILTLASYLQVEPQEICKILDEIDKGSDLVISRRYPRIDSLFNQLQSAVFHWFTRVLTGTQYHDISCGLRAMTMEVAGKIQLYGDLHRFIPLLANQQGFKVAEVRVKQSKRDIRPRVYKPGVYLRRILDIFTLFFLFKFTKKPLRFFGLIGLGLFGVGGGITGYLGLYRILGYGGIADRPLLILGVLMIVLGVQLFSIGLLGEIIIFTHARETKDYRVEQILD